jgi:hypothetical protein
MSVVGGVFWRLNFGVSHLGEQLPEPGWAPGFLVFVGFEGILGRNSIAGDILLKEADISGKRPIYCSSGNYFVGFL